jgi:hypothetical protein
MAGVDWKCTICDKSPPCKCWVRLTCKCGAATTVERFLEAGDLDVIKTKCPKCRDAFPMGREKGTR